METKILKCFAAGCLVLGLQAESSQLDSCTYMSKDPRCWDCKNHPKPPATICLPKESCNVIKSVHKDSSGEFHCKAVNDRTFSCDKLVEVFGTQLEGMVVKVSTPYVDGCHVPGACGPNACVPSYGSASLDKEVCSNPQ